MKKFIKRSTSLFLAVLMCFSSLIGVTATAHAATKQDVYIIDLPRGKETNKEHWGHPAYELMNGWSTFNTDYVTVKQLAIMRAIPVTVSNPVFHYIREINFQRKQRAFGIIIQVNIIRQLILTQ